MKSLTRSQPKNRTTLVGWLIAVGLIFAAMVWFVAAALNRQPDPILALETEVVGNDYRLHFRYPGADRLLHTEDDRFGSRNLYVPAGADVTLHLNSRDYIYTIEIPDVGLYEIAAPDLVFEAQFAAPQNGTLELLGSQMCGYDHEQLIGKMIVQSGADFDQTMSGLTPAPPQFDK